MFDISPIHKTPMKKIILIGLIGCFFTLDSLAQIPVISVTKSCGGLFGYDYVSWQRQYFGPVDEDGNQKMGWVGNCSGRGFRGCRPPAAATTVNDDIKSDEADHYDHDRVDKIIEMIENDLVSQHTSGSVIEMFQMTGQTFQRIYTVTWSTVPITCTDENGNTIASIEIHFESSVNYVALH